MSVQNIIQPWQTNDFRELQSSINSLTNNADFANRRWAQKWFETFQFILGNQSLRWSKNYDFAVDSDNIAQDYSHDRRSQSNYSRVAVESLASMVYSQLPELYFNAKYDDSAATQRLTRLFEGLKTCYDERLQLHDEFDFASVAYVMYSLVYSKVSWNSVAGSRVRRPKQSVTQKPRMTSVIEIDPITGERRSVPVPLTNAEGEPVMMEAYEDMIGEDGNPIYEAVTTGDTVIDMLTPFEVLPDFAAKTFAKMKWIQQVRVMDYDDFMQEYYSQPGAITEVMDRIQGGMISGPAQNTATRHLMRTLYSSPPTMDSQGRSFASPYSFFKNKVFVVEHYDRPTEGHPLRPTPWLAEGRRVVMANGYLCAVSTPQYRTNKLDGWHPFCQARWMPLAQVGQSSGPMADSIQKNREINLTDSLVSHAVQRDSASILLVNETLGLDKSKLTGEPGQVHYVSGDPSSAASYLRNGQPLPALVTQYRQQQKDDLYEISGAMESLRGQSSPGATSGYQARLYEERERKRMTKATNNWENFIANTYMKAFSCIQQNAVLMDPNVVSRIQRSTEGQVSTDDVLAFINGPMDFGVDVTVKAGSMRTKSVASKQADIAEAMSNPAVSQRVMEDPAMLDAYLDAMEIDTFRDMSSIHRERAKKENMWFFDALRMGAAQLQSLMGSAPAVLEQDDDMQHYMEHVKEFIKNQDRYQRNPALFAAMLEHMENHKTCAAVKADKQHPLMMRVFPRLFAQTAGVAQGADLKNAPLREIVDMFRTQKLKEAEAQALASQAGGQDQETPVENSPAPEA